MPVVSVYCVGHETRSGHPKRGSMIEYPVPHNDVTAAAVLQLDSQVLARCPRDPAALGVGGETL